MSHERRSLFLEEESTEPGQYGCSMLARARVSCSGNGPEWRCSLGWAIHGEIDRANCQATDSVIDCWHVHPERKKIISLPEVQTVELKTSAD